MKTISAQENNAICSNSRTGGPLPARERLLEVASEMFAEAGFHGTQLHEISERAGTNVAGVYYHFQSKEQLYQAATMEAGRLLSDGDESSLFLRRNQSAEQRLLRLIKSVLEKLSAKGALAARLVSREFVDTACETHAYAASGLERDFVLLQAAIRDFLGADASIEVVRLNALSVIGECVLYSLAGESRNNVLTQFAVCLPSRARLARLITERSLGALERERTDPEVFHP